MGLVGEGCVWGSRPRNSGMLMIEMSKMRCLVGNDSVEGVKALALILMSDASAEVLVVER